MKNNDQHNKLSGLDWFALSTGLIGLVADFVTIASLVHFDGSHYVAPTIILVVTPVLIMYTTIVLSFYTRRIALVRHMNTNPLLSWEVYEKIRKGGVVSAQTIGTPLLLLYGVCLILSFARPDNISAGIVMLIFFGTPGAMIVVGILASIAGALYAAFDPDYVVAEKKKKGSRSEQAGPPDAQNDAPR
jgi:hypothetical protein